MWNFLRFLSILQCLHLRGAGWIFRIKYLNLILSPRRHFWVMFPRIWILMQPLFIALMSIREKMLKNFKTIYVILKTLMWTYQTHDTIWKRNNQENFWDFSWAFFLLISFFSDIIMQPISSFFEQIIRSVERLS